MTLEVLLWDLKGSVSSSVKVTTGYHSHIFKIGRSEVAAWRSTIVEDLIFKGGLGVINRRVCVFLSQVWVLVLQRPNREGVHGFGASI